MILFMFKGVLLIFLSASLVRETLKSKQWQAKALNWTPYHSEAKIHQAERFVWDLLFNRVGALKGNLSRSVLPRPSNPALFKTRDYILSPRFVSFWILNKVIFQWSNTLELDFFGEKIVRITKLTECRTVIAKFHTLLKAFGPKTPLDSEITYLLVFNI